MVSFVLAHRFKQVARGQSTVIISIEFIEDFLPNLNVLLGNKVRYILPGLEAVSPTVATET